MNLTSTKVVFLSVIFLFVLSCGKDKVEDISSGDETGAFSFTLKSDFVFHEVALTRSEATPTLDDFKVRIENTRAEVLRVWDYKDVPSLIKVVPGSYKLVAWHGNDSLLPAFDRPCYYGETKITLKDGDNLDTTLIAKVSTVKVAVTFDQSFGFDYDDYFVDVKTVGDSLSFSKNETRSGYFKPGKLRLRFVLKPKGKDGYVYFYPEAIAVAKAKEFYNMTLKADTKNGALDKITITTDSTTIDIPVDVELPPFYLPKPAPKVTAQGFSFGDVVETTEGVSKPATVLISSAGGLTELMLKTTSDTLIARGWPQEIDLMKATNEQKTVLKASGLDWSGDIDTKDTIKTTVWVTFNNVIKLLNTAPGVTSGSAFELVAKDRFEQTPATACKFEVAVAPPVFEFINEPGEGNVFAKRVIYDVKYVAEVRKTVVVECQKEGGTWTALKTVLKEQETENAFECVGIGLEPMKTYAFRVRVGEHVLDAGSYKTEDVLQVPNAGMEDWYLETVSTGLFKVKHYLYWAYKLGESNPWWANNNLRSTDWPVAPTNQNSCPAVSYVTGGDVHSGERAVEIRTTGSGSGYANTSTVLYEECIISGMLFVGDYNWSKPNETINSGRPFGVRPSKLSFWYHYTPFETDKFEAYIELQHRNEKENKTLGYGTFQLEKSAADIEYHQAFVDITYEDKSVRATHIVIRFLSSVEKKKVAKNVTINLADLSSKWKAHVGSRLKIDDIELIYE